MQPKNDRNPKKPKDNESEINRKVGQIKEGPFPNNKCYVHHGPEIPNFHRQAKEYDIPLRYMMKGKGGEDKHTHGRVLCKKEALDWWVEESQVPDDNLRRAIDLLYKQPREEVKRYYSIDWHSAAIKFGPPVIERKFVRTKEPSFELPRHLQKTILKESLFPDLTLPDRRVTPAMKREAKELLSLSAEGKLALSSQIRIILNSMDPKVRCLPMQPVNSNTEACLNTFQSCGDKHQCCRHRQNEGRHHKTLGQSATICNL